MIRQQDVTPEIAAALATLRLALGSGRVSTARDAFNILDNAGVFNEIDEAYGYAEPMDVLQTVAEQTIPNTLDPAEWGDTTSADVAQRRGYVPAEVRRALRVPDSDTDGLDSSDRAAEGHLARRALTIQDRKAHGLD